MRLRTFSTLILIITITVGCTSEARPTPTNTPITTATPLPGEITTPSPTPRPEIVIQALVLFPDEELGGYYVIGTLENQSQGQIDSISIQITILNTEEELVSEQVIQPFLNRLSPKAISPFKATFPNVGEAASVNAEILTYQKIEFEEVSIEIDDLQTISTNDGGMAILGLVENPNAKAIVIDAFGLLAVDPQGDPIDLFPYTAGLSWLGPGERAPFLALSSQDPGEVDLVPYYNATLTRGSRSAPLTISTPPKVLITEQGSPMILGTITNTHNRSYDMSFLIILRIEDEILTITSIKPLLPLRPGESRPFAITEFPGLTAQLEKYGSWVGELTAEILVDPYASRPSTRSLVQLDVQITQFEPIGSSLFIKGEMFNPKETGVESATVLAAVRSTAGELLTAGWTYLLEILPGNGSREFVLHLSLPEGADPAMTEYDVQAFGLLP
ncbi:MAG: hypothetical protein AMJ88_11025 [Anaerolineae bacterium SM23_ 63]|nr:MAG: hypothetical protein AMJ88_11025 [Anaerolineae bacterium SM23_ 63]